MKEAVAGELAAAYDSGVVDEVRANDYTFTSGRLTIHLAREFGFCYGVDRAVDYAYQARRRFPGRNVFLTGEIIHNPHVNERLRDSGIRFLSDPGQDRAGLGPDDVVILPAFGVTVGEMAQLTSQGCTLVDTTCGSVLNVWKNVTRYAQDGFTSIIHGKVKHEETRATASQALRFAGGRYLVVLDRDEASLVCDYIRNGGDRSAFLARFGGAASPGFDPDVDLVRVGCANQTTMLMTESLAIGEMFRDAIADRYGAGRAAGAFPRLRHHLQRDAGTPGRGHRPAERAAARPDAGRRRLQQQQYLQSGPDLRRSGPHVPHRRSGLPGLAGRSSPSAGRRPLDHGRPRGSDAELAGSERQRHRGPYGRCVDAQQHRGTGDQPARGVLPAGVSGGQRSSRESSGAADSAIVTLTLRPRWRERNL